MGAADDQLLLTKSTVYVGYLSLSVSLSLSVLFSFLSLLFPLSLQVASHHNDLKFMFVSATVDADNYSLATFQYSQSLYTYFPLMSSSFLPYLWTTFRVQ